MRVTRAVVAREVHPFHRTDALLERAQHGFRMKELIESRQIRAFVAVARRGNFTQGAKDVFLTQSAVSHAIKSLEQELGCHLFQRVGRSAVLTHAGERLLAHCEEILHKMQDARMDLSQLPDLGRPVLRIGAPMTICQHILPGVLRKVQQEYPQCGLRVETGDNPQLLAQLLSGKIDVAVMVDPERRPDLVFEPLFGDELRFVMLPTHPWAGASEITDTSIAEATLILPNKATRTHQLVTAYFRTARVAVDRCIELGSVESIKELVKNGLGIGVVAEWPIRAELARGELVTRPLGDRPLHRQWHAVSLRERGLNAMEENLISLFREDASALVNSDAELEKAAAQRPRRKINVARPLLAGGK
jgi:LysR family transcriptional regulator, low CO2-responsive transcriptional regulator